MHVVLSLTFSNPSLLASCFLNMNALAGWLCAFLAILAAAIPPMLEEAAARTTGAPLEEVEVVSMCEKSFAPSAEAPSGPPSELPPPPACITSLKPRLSNAPALELPRCRNDPVRMRLTFVRRWISWLKDSKLDTLPLPLLPPAAEEDLSDGAKMLAVRAGIVALEEAAAAAAAEEEGGRMDLVRAMADTFVLRMPPSSACEDSSSSDSDIENDEEVEVVAARSE